MKRNAVTFASISPDLARLDVKPSAERRDVWTPLHGAIGDYAFYIESTFYRSVGRCSWGRSWPTA